uniref:Serpin domain-containing protein n=1 Tax=Panagrolaimus davidi TaxID=227884 RepID=A0A914Q0T2_9BILA
MVSDILKFSRYTILMMEGVTFSRYSNNELYECVQIPFQDQIFSMYIILPHEKYGLSEILKYINVIEILEFMETSERQTGKIILPKFEKLESSFQFSGDDEILKHLKIEDAFDKNRADFAGISMDKNLHISKLIHRAVVKALQLESPPPAKEMIFVQIIPQPITFTFIADHSFLYFIADKARNVHFIGTYYD